jgi:hypothetical protein
MGTERKDLAAASSFLDDATDDLIALYPREPPNVSVNVIYIELDSSHVAAVETDYARLPRTGKVSFARRFRSPGTIML